MRGRRLTILAAISLTCLAVLLCGYFARVGLGVRWYTPTNAQTPRLHIRGAGLERGRCYLAFRSITMPVRAPNMPTNFQVIHDLRLGWPQAGPSIWEFTFERTLSGEPFLAFPIWCLAVPCTIAPILWWRRRRRRTGRGFAVEQVASAALMQPRRSAGA